MLKRVLAPVVLGGLMILAAGSPAVARGGGGHMGGGHMGSRPVMMHGGGAARTGMGHFRSPMNRNVRNRHDFFRFRHHHRFFFFDYPFYPYYPSYCPGPYGYAPYPGPYPYYPAYCPAPYDPYGYGGYGPYGGGNRYGGPPTQPMPGSQPMPGGMSAPSGY